MFFLTERRDYFLTRSNVIGKAFHSGTDTQDLIDNAPSFPFFLSLVVNYASTPFAEIAVAGEIEQKSVVRNKWKLKGWKLNNDKIEKRTDKKPVTYIIPCEVCYLTDQWLVNQVEAIKERNKPKPYVAPVSQKTLGFQFDRQDTKPASTQHNPKGYRRLIDEFAELFTLGTGTTETFTTAPSYVYDFMDKYITVPMVDDYKDAFKEYFLTSWYEMNGIAQFVTEKEAVACIRHFISQLPNKDKWLTREIHKALNELENEIDLLQSVQGSTLV